MVDISSWGVDQHERRKRQEDPFRRIDVLELPIDPQLRMRAEECIDIYLRDAILFQINAVELADLISDYPCPRTENQAIVDADRYVLHTQSPLCYVSSLPQMSNEITTALTVYAAQQCCYENG